MMLALVGSGATSRAETSLIGCVPRQLFVVRGLGGPTPGRGSPIVFSLQSRNGPPWRTMRCYSPSLDADSP
jgi:hypothetical protein